MDIVSIIILLLGVGSSYIFFRNNFVYEFQIYISDLVYQANMEDINSGKFDLITRRDRLRIKPSYGRMVFSFKRLKLESWFTEEEIKLLGVDKSFKEE